MLIKLIKKFIIGILSIIFVGLLIPQNLKMPVVGAGSNSYSHKTFWHEGWGSSIVHKGIDVFARKGTSIRSATWGMDDAPLGWQKMFYLNPIDYLKEK